MIVCGIVGPSAAGKSSVVAALRRALGARLAVVACDDSYKPAARCPIVDLHALPWPLGRTPDAFARRGCADMNHPDAIEWRDVAADVCRAGSKSDAGDRIVIVEGLLLASDHRGAARVRELCDVFVVLGVPSDDADAQEACWRRKWTREHLGKQSYRSRGVDADDYRCYWERYVWPRWVEHGAASMAMTEIAAAPSTLQLRATDAPAQSVARLVAWLDAQRASPQMQ